MKNNFFFDLQVAPRLYLFKGILCLQSVSINIIHIMGTAIATVQIPWEMEIIVSSVVDLHVRRIAD